MKFLRRSARNEKLFFKKLGPKGPSFLTDTISPARPVPQRLETRVDDGPAPSFASQSRSAQKPASDFLPQAFGAALARPEPFSTLSPPLAAEFFITGTDTEVGKTYTTVALLKYFNEQGLQTAALKPIASDATSTPNGLRNDDALQLQAAMSMEFSYHQVNPFVFEPAIAPHIAAAPHRLDVQSTLKACHTVLNSPYDILLIEGAGGWSVPLNDQENFADLAAAFGFPILLVVGLKLGCLNHTTLTFENIKARNLPFAGWIANHIDPHMQKPSENIQTLEKIFDTPPLAVVPYAGESIF